MKLNKLGRLDPVFEIRSISHGRCNYIRVYINAVANNVMLQLYLHYFITIFKIKHKLYITPASAPPPQQGKSLGALLTLAHFLPEDAGSKLRRNGNIQTQTSRHHNPEGITH